MEKSNKRATVRKKIWHCRSILCSLSVTLKENLRSDGHRCSQVKHSRSSWSRYVRGHHHKVTSEVIGWGSSQSVRKVLSRKLLHSRSRLLAHSTAVLATNEALVSSNKVSTLASITLATVLVWIGNERREILSNKCRMENPSTKLVKSELNKLIKTIVTRSTAITKILIRGKQNRFQVKCAARTLLISVIRSNWSETKRWSIEPFCFSLTATWTMASLTV